MKESYSERLAIYTGPESCGVVREDNVEALTGESAGRVFSRGMSSEERRLTCSVGGKPIEEKVRNLVAWIGEKRET